VVTPRNAEKYNYLLNRADTQQKTHAFFLKFTKFVYFLPTHPIFDQKLEEKWAINLDRPVFSPIFHSRRIVAKSQNLKFPIIFHSCFGKFCKVAEK